MIYLEPDHLQALKGEARSKGISVAELIRRLVREHLEARKTPFQVPPEAYLKIVGLGASGKPDISERHDEYFGKALSREHDG